MGDLDLIKKSEWERQRSQLEGSPDDSVFLNGIDSLVYSLSASTHYISLEHHLGFQEYLRDPRNTVLHACHILVLMMHLFFGLARRATNVLIHGLCTIVLLSSGAQSTLWDNVSIDLVTIFKKYRLDPITHNYVCCPRCFALYDPSSAPPQCTFKEFNDSTPCKAQLFRTRVIRANKHVVQIRTYLHQDLKQWVGRFLSRPDIDEILDRPPPTMATKFMEDIWHGSILSKLFKGPDGSRFHTQPHGPLRLVFGLAVDGFNSYRNIQAKKKATSTGIYMVCFNLPSDIRYLPENMYLAGVIPVKPSLDQINHPLSLSVKDLKPFWTPGVHYTRTARYQGGRCVHAALIPLISDILAARQVGGLGASGHGLFCLGCLLTLEEIEQLDPSLWPPRTMKFHLEGVRAWKNARSSDERAKVFERYAARWSALLDLPYWNALDFTVIESMHNHYLGLLQNHIRAIWGIDIEAEDSQGLSDPKRKPPPIPVPEVMRQGAAALASGDRISLLKFERRVLWHLCANLNLRRAKTKKMMVKELLNWVCLANFVVGQEPYPLQRENNNLPPTEAQHLEKENVLQAEVFSYGTASYCF